MEARALVLALAAAVTPLAGGCKSSPAGWTRGPAGPYDVLPQEAALQFAQARAAVDAAVIDGDSGGWGLARVTLDRLTSEHPRNLPVAILQQELELESGEPSRVTRIAMELSPSGAEVGFAERLRRAYRVRADAEPSARNLFLAARVEEDLPAALVLLDRAIEVDPECAWAHYARAHVAAREGDWQASREALDEALRLDPDLMPARRLEAWMLARRGRLDEAALALEWWLPRAAGDPVVARADWLESKLDLAGLLVLQGKAGEARSHLDELDELGLRDGRTLAVRAAAEEELGNPEAALAAAAEAERLEPTGTLPVVQQALLYQYWLDDPESARESWQRVLARSGEEQDLAVLLQRTRARVYLERAAAAAIGTPAEGEAVGSDAEPGGPAALKAVVQRVLHARVRVDGEVVGAIGAGMLVLLGVMDGDEPGPARRLAEKIARFRFFRDDAGRMNLSALDLGLEALVVSQFTLAADGRRGRRPSFDRAAHPEVAEELYERFVGDLRELGLPTETGRFGAMMQVELVNDGPVTFVLEERTRAGEGTAG